MAFWPPFWPFLLVKVTSWPVVVPYWLWSGWLVLLDNIQNLNVRLGITTKVQLWLMIKNGHWFFFSSKRMSSFWRQHLLHSGTFWLLCFKLHTSFTEIESNFGWNNRHKSVELYENVSQNLPNDLYLDIVGRFPRFSSQMPLSKSLEIYYYCQKHIQISTKPTAIPGDIITD